MARIDRVREKYESVTNRLFTDKKTLSEYLKFAGRLYKLPTSQSMTIYGENPKATMVADFGTWNKFNRHVKRGTNSMAVIDGGELKHYFDISQTMGYKKPYQWILDRDIAKELIAKSGTELNTFTGLVNWLGAEKARENIGTVLNTLNISEKNRAAFEKSYVSMVQNLIAGRCENGGKFHYNGQADLTAFDMLHSKAEKERLCEMVQIAGKSVLLSLERTINDIILKRRTDEHERSKADMVQGGQEVLPRNEGGERENIQARSGNIRVSGTGGTGADGGRTEADERTDRTVGREVETVHAGELSGSDTVARRSAEMGAHTATGGQRGLGVSGNASQTVHEEEPAPDNIRRASEVGEHIGNVGGQGDNGGHSAPVQGLKQNNTDTAEVDAPAVSVSSELLQALKDRRTVYLEDDPEQMIADARKDRITNRRIEYDADESKYIVRGDSSNHGQTVKNAWLYSTGDAEEIVNYLTQNGYKISRYEDKVPEKTAEEYDKEYIALKVRSILLNSQYSDAADNDELVDAVYSKAFAYAYDEKTQITNIPPDDLADMVYETVSGLVHKKQEELPLEKLEDIDKFYVNAENESVTWVYFNPDSQSGGQLVYNHFTYDQLFDAIITNDPLDYLSSVSRTELVDIDTPDFAESARYFLGNNETFSTKDEDYADKLSALIEPRYAIFQLREGDNLRDYRFRSLGDMNVDGLYVDRENYTRVYRGRLKPGETPEDIYERFNINRPDDFHGHSLSMSDIVTIKDQGNVSAHYVDRVGFVQIYDFTLSREERVARRMLLDRPHTIAEQQLASDEMDDLGDKLFDYKNAIRISGSADGMYFGDGMPYKKFEELTEKHNKGEDIRAELAKGVYHFFQDQAVIRVPDRNNPGHEDSVTLSCVRSDKGVTFTTKGGFEVQKTWEDLGDDLIFAARLEYDRHQKLDKEYAEQQAISDFKKHTKEAFHDINGRSAEDVEELTREFIDGILADNEIKAKIVDIALTGSRSRGIENSGSDIDITVEFDTDLKEDALFNILHEKPYDLDGIEIDINPIRAQETGTLGSYLPTAEKYLSEKAARAESTIHFGLLGNGITCYDTSRTDPETHDYITIAHISNEGNIKYYDESLGENDKRLIETEAQQQKQKFTADWNRLDTATKYARILDTADVSQLSHIHGDEHNNDLTLEDVVKKYEHGIIFKDEEMPDYNKLERLDWSKEQGLYYYPAQLGIDDLAAIKQESDSYVIAAPSCIISESFMEQHNITFLKIGRDVPIDFAEMWDDERINVMLEAIDRIDQGLEPGYDVFDVTEIAPEQEIIRDNTEVPENRSVNPHDERAEEAESVTGTPERSAEDIYSSLSVSDRTFFDTNAYADILYIEKQVENAGADKAAEQIRLSDREKSYAEQFGITHDEFRALVRYHEAELAKHTLTVGVNDLTVGDNVRYDGNVWSITAIDGDFSIKLENVDKTANMAVRSIVGHWKEHFENDGFEYILPDEVEKMQEQPASAAKESITDEENEIEPAEYEDEEYDDEPDLSDDEEYDEYAEPIQLDFFGNPIGLQGEKKEIIAGIDINAAFRYEVMHYGTGFQDGKFRVEEFYKSHKPDNKDFAKLLSKEYGIGGHSGDGKIWFVNHDGKGIELDIKLDNGGRTKVNWKWTKIAKLVANLIENQEYIKQKDIDDRIYHAKFDVAHNEPGDAYYERAVKILDSYGIDMNPAAHVEEQAPEQEKEPEEVKLRSTVIDIANGKVYNTEYKPPEPKEEQSPIEGVPAYKVGDHIEVDYGHTHYSGTLSYIGDIDVTVIPDVGYSWEAQAINRQTFDEQLRKDSRNAHLFTVEQEKHDFVITDENLGVGGAKAKFAANVNAIKTLKSIETENRLATAEEQTVLAGYVGWGGLSQAFDPANSSWSKEYEELKVLLTEDEYSSAKGSTVNAHYTSPVVINAIYKGLQNLGFEGGNILEPAMGVGNFFGVMPEGMRKNSHLSGVELDSITGRIARQLYQTADIQVKGYEKTDFSDNYFDAAVGNVPFGSYSVSDKRYNRENFFIHDYFLAKTLDKLAPGGIAAFVTTKGTMDKENPKVREYLAKRADLIGAIRLPNTAFKANAGTEVTADILFLQKREKMAVEMPDWCYISRNDEGIPVNSYFIDHPEMLMGVMKQGVEFSLYGNAAETACVPIEGADLKEQLEKAVNGLKLANALRKHTEERNAEIGVIPAVEDVRNFTYAEIDGKVYFRENNIMKEAVDKDNKLITGKKLDRLKALCRIRETFRAIIDIQEKGCTDEQLAEQQKKLNEQYDSFVKEYGYISDRANYLVFGDDDDYNSLTALEVVDEETKKVKKADFFDKRTVKVHTEIDHVDTAQEAMNVAMDTIGHIDIPYMAKLCGREPEEVVEVLKSDGLIFLDPDKMRNDDPYAGWEEASEYLSGNVRIKLRAAELAAESNPDLQRNVDALKAVIPPRIEAGEIAARIGVHWVDVEDYMKFAKEYAKTMFWDPLRRAYNGEYKIPNKSSDRSESATSIFGTKRMSAMEIFENLLNQRDIIVKDKVYDPITEKDHYVVNKKETELAQEKANKMKEAFKRWLWENPERREKYVTRYNELFNSLVGRKYDGSHQSFPGMSPAIELKPHQLNAVARAKFGGNTLLAHCVGAGKSFEMVAATMEKKRLGLINKACVVVPKSIVGQMALEWLKLYPQAKILTASEKDFDRTHRQKFIGRCCTGDYDAVIMSYEQFEKIPMSFEYRRNFIQREIDSLVQGISDLSGDYRSKSDNRASIKDMERTKKRMEAKLAKLIEDNGKKKDTSLNFEQLGFDSLVVDECHNYKNGLVVTKMQRVAGVQTTASQKAEDILMKTTYLNDTYGEKNIIMASGTPVSNSMTELYIMQRYLRPSLLAQAGLQTFDDWASTFGEVVSKAELKPAGDGYRTKKRFAKFNNLPELMAMYKEFADVQIAENLDLKVPKMEGGKPQAIAAEPNEFQQAYMKILAERSEKIHNGSVDASVDNMLKVTAEARLLGLDARAINPDSENYPDSKVNICIDKVMEIYKATTEIKGVQAIFCDIAVNGNNEMETSDDKTESAEPVMPQETRFSVYNYIKAELIRRGIPADEICFAGEATTNSAQKEMKAQLRAGTKRIVLSSTSKLGTGANIQNKLVALHNLDIPWRPSDLEQRIGRIIRQGNDNDVVGVYNYVTKNTFDAYLMNIIVTKQKFISQLMSGKTPARSCEDVDETVLNYSEIQAMASGDERIKEKIELDTDVARLKMLESEHYNEQYRLDDTIDRAQKKIKEYGQCVEAVKADLALSDANRPKDSEDFRVELFGKVYNERKAAGEVIRNAAVKFLAQNDLEHEHIGSLCGFELSLNRIVNGFVVSTGLTIKNKMAYTTELDISGDIGNVTRMMNLLTNGINSSLARFEGLKKQNENDLQAALASKGKPFEHAEELAAKSARLEQLNLELEVGSVDEVIMNDDDETQDAPERKDNTHDDPEHNRDSISSNKHNRH